MSVTLIPENECNAMMRLTLLLLKKTLSETVYKYRSAHETQLGCVLTQSVRFCDVVSLSRLPRWHQTLDHRRFAHPEGVINSGHDWV